MRAASSCSAARRSAFALSLSDAAGSRPNMLGSVFAGAAGCLAGLCDVETVVNVGDLLKCDGSDIVSTTLELGLESAVGLRIDFIEDSRFVLSGLASWGGNSGSAAENDLFLDRVGDRNEAGDIEDCRSFMTEIDVSGANRLWSVSDSRRSITCGKCEL